MSRPVAHLHAVQPQASAAQAPARAKAPTRSAWLLPPGSHRAAAAAAAAGASHRRRCRRLRAERGDAGAPQPEDSSSSSAGSGASGAGGGASSEGAGSLEEKLAALADLNQLQTALNRAIASEEWDLAAKIRDLLRLLTSDASGSGGGGGRAADWRGLGVLGWLADRAENLGFTLPTEVQKRAAPVILDGDDCIIQSETGSGKTLSFLLPALSLLSYPPETYPDDLKGPQALVVVPTRELGVQVVMLVYRLFGGSVNQGVPGQGGNMFEFHGPRGLKVKGLLLDSEVLGAKKDYYLKGAHVLVGTPELLAAALAPPEGVEAVQHADVVCVDEVDACFQAHPEEMELIMELACRRGTAAAAADSPEAAGGGAQPEAAQQREQPGQEGGEARERQHASSSPAGSRQKPVVVLVGATLDEPLVEHAVAQGWVRDPVTVRVGDRMRIPSGLQHRCIVVPDEGAKVAAMCRQIRADLRGQSADEAPARVMVFAGSEDEARRLSDPLRTVLWGDHKISVLLPEGTEPIKALHSFRDNKTTLLLATPAAARGLDLPAVSHVYNLQPPPAATEYLHRAGRSGRIGSPVQGVVTTLVTEEELPALLTMAAELGVAVEQQAPLPPELPAVGEAAEPGAEPAVDVEAARRGLEDLFNLY